MVKLEPYATTKAWTLTTGDGAKTVYVQFKTGAGLESTPYSDQITLQSSSSTLLATGSIAINGGAATTSSTSVTLTLSATDNSGTVAQMRFANMGNHGQPGTIHTIKAWTLPPGTGTKTVLAQFKDGSGIESAPTETPYYSIRHLKKKTSTSLLDRAFTQSRRAATQASQTSPSTSTEEN